MRTTQLVRAVFLIVCGSLGTTSALAQSVVVPVVGQCPEVGDASAMKVGSKHLVLAEKSAPTSSFTSESTSAVSVPPSGSILPAAPSALVIAEASTLSAHPAEASQVSLLEEHKLNVKVQFDQRPVGGILTVRVSMTPTFRGIGVSTRPATSRSIALAVDEFTQDAVNKLVKELTEEIQTEFKAINEANAAHKDAQIN